MSFRCCRCHMPCDPVRVRGAYYCNSCYSLEGRSKIVAGQLSVLEMRRRERCNNCEHQSRFDNKCHHPDSLYAAGIGMPGSNSSGYAFFNVTDISTCPIGKVTSDE